MTYPAGRVWVLSAFVLPCFALAENDPVDLRPHFEVGQRYYVQYDSDAIHRTRGDLTGNRVLKVDAASSMGVWQTVSEVSDRRVVLKLTFDRQAMKFTHPAIGMCMQYDSSRGDAAAPPDCTLARMLSPWPGRTLTFVASPRGLTETIEGFDEILEAMDDSVGEDDPLYHNLRAGFTAANTRTGLVDSRYVLLPPAPVRVGDQWSSRLETSDAIFGEVVYLYQCRLERITDAADERTAEIAFEGQVETLGGAEPPPTRRGLLPHLGEWTFAGAAAVNVEWHQIVEQEWRTEMKLRLDFPGQDGGALHIRQVKNSRVRVLTEAEYEAQRRAAAAAPARPPVGESAETQGAPGPANASKPQTD